MNPARGFVLTLLLVLPFWLTVAGFLWGHA
jgi:hypothetical protein